MPEAVASYQEEQKPRKERSEERERGVITSEEERLDEERERGVDSSVEEVEDESCGEWHKTKPTDLALSTDAWCDRTLEKHVEQAKPKNRGREASNPQTEDREAGGKREHKSL